MNNLHKVRRVIAHNDGEIVGENCVGEDVQVRVRKARETLKKFHEED